MDRIFEYQHKCKILRQIQSNKAKRYSSINKAQNFATVAVSSLLTFIGFSGIDKIHSYVSLIFPVEKLTVEFLFNSLVFILFVLVIAHLVFQIGKKQSASEQAVVYLTNLINQIDDMFYDHDNVPEFSSHILDMVRQKYEAIIQVIPPNTDREFIKAKKDFQEKEMKKSNLPIGPPRFFEESKQGNLVEAIISEYGDALHI